MRILAVSPHLPHEGVPHAGGEYLLRHLETIVDAGHEARLVVPASPEVRDALADAPPWLDVVTTPFEIEPLTSLAAVPDRLRRRTRFSGLGRPALRGLRTAGLDDLAAGADIVELHWQETALLGRELARRGIRTPAVVFAYDLDSEAAAARAGTVGGWRDRTRHVTTAALRGHTERADLAAARLVLVFKPEDEQRLRRAGIRARVQVVDPYLVAPEPDAPPRDEAALLFTGAMWRPENHRGVSWFVREVWPSVHAAVPGATFTVAGADPPPALVALAASVPGVVVTGRVADLGPYYARASAFVAPLFVAGGLKCKVAQAMMHGLPVVATPTAAAGIVGSAPPGTFWAIAHEPSTMAASLVDLLRRPAAGAATGARAAAWCRAHYSFAASTTRLLETYAELSGCPV